MMAADFKVLEDHNKKQKPKVYRQEEDISNAPIQEATRHPNKQLTKGRRTWDVTGQPGKQAQVRSSKLRDTSGKTRKRPISQGAQQDKTKLKHTLTRVTKGNGNAPPGMHPSKQENEGAAGRGGSEGGRE